MMEVHGKGPGCLAGWWEIFSLWQIGTEDQERFLQIFCFCSPAVQSEYTPDIPGFSLRDESTLVTLAEETLEVSDSKSGNLPVRNLRNGKRSQSNSRFQT
jgi:hypothetical protein